MLEINNMKKLIEENICLKRFNERESIKLNNILYYICVDILNKEDY